MVDLGMAELGAFHLPGHGHEETADFPGDFRLALRLGMRRQPNHERCAADGGKRKQ